MTDGIPEDDLRELIGQLRHESNHYLGEEDGHGPTQYQKGGMHALSYAADELETLLDE